MAEAKKLLAESGYDGTPVVIMAPGDVVDAEGAADRRGAVAARSRLQGRPAGHRLADRGRPAAPARSRRRKAAGTCSSPTGSAPTWSNPIVNVSDRRPGKNGGWFGWAEDAKIEELRDAFARSSSPDEQKKIATEIQKEAYDQVIYIPLGQYLIPSAWRKSLTGVLDGPATPMFWNIDKSSSEREARATEKTRQTCSSVAFLFPASAVAVATGSDRRSGTAALACGEARFLALFASGFRLIADDCSLAMSSCSNCCMTTFSRRQVPFTPDAQRRLFQ